MIFEMPQLKHFCDVFCSSFDLCFLCRSSKSVHQFKIPVNLDPYNRTVLRDLASTWLVHFPCIFQWFFDDDVTWWVYHSFEQLSYKNLHNGGGVRGLQFVRGISLVGAENDTDMSGDWSYVGIALAALTDTICEALVAADGSAEYEVRRYGIEQLWLGDKLLTGPPIHIPYWLCPPALLLGNMPWLPADTWVQLSGKFSTGMFGPTSRG